MKKMIKRIAYVGLNLALVLTGVNAMATERKDAPKTLFEMVGAVQPAPSWKDSVLIIVDAQKEYETGALALPSIRPTVKVIESLLLQARKNSVPVIHVVHEGGPGLFDPASEEFQIIDELTPLKGELVIRKQLPDSFAGTDLQKKINALGKNRKPIIVGFMTHMCVSATAMTALNLGYETTVVSDAVATRDLRAVNGKTISAAQVNESSLAALKDRISWIVSSKELLK